MRLVTINSAGLAVTIGAGAVAMVFQWRARLLPLTRLLFALLATLFLLNQLAYATSGGFHKLYDPAWAAATLAHYGLHVLAWLPPLVLFAASAVFGARAIVGAFREHFGSRSRLHALKQMTATLGVAGLLYFAAFYIERKIGTGTIHILPSVSVRAEQVAATRSQAPPFPIQRVLIAIGVAAFVAALASPVVRHDGTRDTAPSMVPRQHAIGVAVAAFVCFVAITVLVRV